MTEKQKRASCATLLVMMLAVSGCTSGENIGFDSNSTAASLPPLITTLSTETEASTTETVESPPAEPLYKGMTFELPLPEDAGELQSFRCAGDTLILYTKKTEETGRITTALYQLPWNNSGEAARLYSIQDEDALSALLDFDVQSDGTICGLLCRSTAEIPYDDPDFNAEAFDWENYYENAAAYYELAWFDSAGNIRQQVNLSDLLPDDENLRQTAAFTGIRCGADNRIYLTFVMEDQDYLTALDKNNTLLPAAGNTTFLSISAAHQLFSAGGHLMMTESDANGNIDCVSLSVSGDGLHKTMVSLDGITEDMLPVELYTTEYRFGWRDADGIYLASEETDIQPTYLWNDLRIEPEDVTEVLQLSGNSLLMAVSSARGSLTLQLVQPEGQQ